MSPAGGTTAPARARGSLPALLLAGAALLPAPAGAETAEARQLALFESLQEVIVQVSSRVKPWVVHIEAVQKSGDRKFKVLGSGLILDSQGRIVTNHHIVDEAKLITVTLPEGSKLEATLLGSDQQTDLALIQVEPRGKELPVPRLGDSNDVEVGQWIIAVGNPYGFDRTVYFGIVSGKGRTLSSLNPYQDVDSGFAFTTDFIQTDASIDSGSSGGPLVNLKGEVIGINSMGLGRGISFTVPINTVKDVINQLLTHGKLARGWVGLSVQPLTRTMASYFRIGSRGGVLVSEVISGSPADKAGFRQGDIIVELNGKEVGAENEEELNHFSRMIWSSEVGARIGAQVKRKGKNVPLTMVVGEQPKMKAREVETEWGFNVKEITEDLFRSYLLDDRGGVLVTFVEAGTAGGEARLLEGDVIKEIEGASTSDLPSFEERYDKLKGRTDEVLLLVKRRKDFVYVLLELDKYKTAP